MTALQAHLAEVILRFSPGDGMHVVPLAGVHCIKLSQSDRRTKRYWSASLCIIVQGAKEILLGRETYRHRDEAHYIATAIDLPVTSRVVSVSPGKPFLCLKIELDPLALSEVAAQLERNFATEAAIPLRPIFIGNASEGMLEAAVRLGRLLDAPEDAAVVGPLVVKELIYHLLKGPDGPSIRQFVRSGSRIHKMTQAIYRLRAELDQEVDVTALATTAGMSRSAFFKHFKEVTSLSPIQYQKRLRLLEARRLMAEEGESAEGSAFRVGYRSSSQFSREYSRMFGNAPLRDAVKIKELGEPIHQM